MKNRWQSKSRILLPLLIGATWFNSFAQLQVATEDTPQNVFEGEARRINLQMRNKGDHPIEAKIRAVLSQAGSATVVRISDTPWKKVQILPGQTITESAVLALPAVRAETPFLIQWIEGASNVVGRTDVLVYPTNLLQEFKVLVGVQENALGVYDPLNQLKPLLKMVSVEFADLEDVGLESFRGKLALVGPFSAKKQMPEGLPAQIESLAKKGVRVVWLQPPAERHDKLQPSFYAVPVGKATVIVVQPELVTNLGENPQAQLNLIYFARIALRPEPLHLSHF